MPSYTSAYPISHDDTYVKATSKYSTGTWPYFATDPAKSLTGDYTASRAWLAALNTVTNQRFHVDLGSAKIIRRLYYENSHHFGGFTGTGVKDYIIQGSNDATAFSTLTYATDTNWTQLATGTFASHSLSDASDPQYVVISNTTAYRYYAIKCVDALGGGGVSVYGLRRVEFQTEDGYTAASSKHMMLLGVG